MKIEELIKFGNEEGYQIPVNLEQAKRWREETKMNLSSSKRLNCTKEEIVDLATEYDFYNEMVVAFGGKRIPLEEITYPEN